MTEADKIRALVGYRLEQAEEALTASAMNLESGLIRSAANRAYYAMFYAVLALLATDRKETSKHSGAIALFDYRFVKPAILPKELSRWLHDAFALRQQADYAPERRVTEDQARTAAQQVREFVDRVRAILHERLASTEDEEA